MARSWSRSHIADGLPVAHSLRTTGFIVQSDFRIADNAPIIQELETLKQQIGQSLQLPAQRDPVVVYLFSDESGYRSYMEKTWPALPQRRAYFIGTSRELAVYSFHGPGVEEDLRHELTHGLLHASLKTVPLWLDEGLAEYFEVRGTNVGEPHHDHLRTLRKTLSSGWRPSLAELEGITDFQKMTQRDYAESWAWVHYLLHSHSQGESVLQNYIAGLRDSEAPGAMADLLGTESGGSAMRMTAWVTEMSAANPRGIFHL